MICFVSAPAGLDTRPVIDTLTLEGIDHIEARSLSSGGPLIEAIREGISSSDLVLVILPAKEPDPPMFMIEVGLALGLAKQLLVVVPKSRQPPSVLSEVQCVRADPGDVEALRLNVRAALKEAGRPRSPHGQLPTLGPQRELASWLTSTLDALSTAPPQEAGSILERTVAELFRRSGGQVEPSRWPQSGPDLAVLFDAPSPIEGALLVEVKTLRSRADLRATMLQAQQHVLQRGATLGVVTYLSKGRTIERPSPVPRIIAIDLSQLPRRLESQSLGEILRNERNLAVHEM